MIPHTHAERRWTVDFLMKYFQLVVSQTVIRFCWQDWGKNDVISQRLPGNILNQFPRKLCTDFLAFKSSMGLPTEPSAS